jgi:hypothetical protein
VYVYLHVGRVMSAADGIHLGKQLEYRWRRISSPVHALAFYCDPFFHPFRCSIRAASLDIDGCALELGNEDLFSQCRTAIEMLCRLDDDGGAKCHAAKNKFFHFSEGDGKVATQWGDSTKFRPKRLWSQGQATFPVLAERLMKVYSVPSSTAGVERNHKVAKRIHTAARNRMSSGKVEQQVAVAHNGVVSSMTLKDERQSFEVLMQQHLMMNASTVEELTNQQSESGANQLTLVAQTDSPRCDDGASDDALDGMTEDEVAEQEALSAALALSSIALMPESLLFPLHEEF